MKNTTAFATQYFLILFGCQVSLAIFQLLSPTKMNAERDMGLKYWTKLKESQRKRSAKA